MNKKIIVAFVLMVSALVVTLHAQSVFAYSSPPYNALAACKTVTFSRALSAGKTGADVLCLQTILNQNAATQIAISGSGSPGSESRYFGTLTKSAVMKFQELYAAQILTPLGYVKGTGIVGPATIAKLNQLLMQAPPVSQQTPVTPQAAAMPASAATQSQSNATEAAIAKASPAVVSVIVSKQVPEYQVIYEAPFGNDPMFGNVQVPVYTPTGNTVTKQIGAGTGFLVTADGYIVTNKHVIFDDQAIYTVTLSTGSTVPAEVFYKDPQNDVAILKISGNNYPVLQLADSSLLQLGQPVITIGNALGQYSNSVSLGIISGLHRTIQASDSNGSTETLNDVIQTDAAINPGNSGGPLLNLDGAAVGINVAMVQGSSNISFAIPINPVKDILKMVLHI